jgi:hypothetical protein
MILGGFPGDVFYAQLPIKRILKGFPAKSKLFQRSQKILNFRFLENKAAKQVVNLFSFKIKISS